MEAEERPAKIRKLSHGDDGDGDEQTGNAVSLAEAKAANENGDLSTAAGTVPAQVDAIATSNVAPLTADNNVLSAEDLDGTLPSPEELSFMAPVEGEGPATANGDHPTTSPILSKNQQKQLRKKAEWEAKREERKAIRKEKLLAKRERKRQARENGADAPPVPKQPRPRRIQLPITFLIDCDFDDLMRDNERISLASQVTRSYSDNKNSAFPVHLAICSFGGKLKDRFDTILAHYKSWRGVRFLDCDFVEAAEMAKEWMNNEHGGRLAGSFSPLAALDEDARIKLKDEGEVVYLSSEADEILTELKPYSTYIIGGLVDKNREKGICYKRATKRGVRTARLPIGEFMDMQSRKVLATNHVNEIMLQWLECGDWGEAFMKVIPKRKGGSLKRAKDQSGKDEGEEFDDDSSQPHDDSRTPADDSGLADEAEAEDVQAKTLRRDPSSSPLTDGIE